MSNIAEKDASIGGTARTAARLRIGILFIFGLILALYVIGRLGLHLGRAGVLFRTHPGAPPGVAYLGDGIMLLLAIAIYWLSAALKSVAQGALFTRRTVRQFRQFALWLLIMALYSFAAPLFFGSVGRWLGIPHRVLVAIDVRDLLLIGITALLFLLSRLLERAGEIEQENRGIV